MESGKRKTHLALLLADQWAGPRSCGWPWLRPWPWLWLHGPPCLPAPAPRPPPGGKVLWKPRLLPGAPTTPSGFPGGTLLLRPRDRPSVLTNHLAYSLHTHPAESALPHSLVGPVHKSFELQPPIPEPRCLRLGGRSCFLFSPPCPSAPRMGRPLS